MTYIDGQQTLGATIKFGFTEPFTTCTIGMAPNQNIRRTSNNGTKDSDNRLLTSSSIDSAAGAGTAKGMLPSLMERSFFSQVSDPEHSFCIWLDCNQIKLLMSFYDIFSGGKLLFVALTKYIVIGSEREKLSGKPLDSIVKLHKIYFSNLN